MDEKIVESAMQLIFYAGNAKSDAMRAIGFAEDGKDDKAQNALINGKNQLREAHKIQTDLMTKEVQEGLVEKSIILIHAQDHFMGAVTSLDLGEKIVVLNQRLSKLEQKLEGVNFS